MFINDIKIVNLGELKAQYIREAEHKAANTLDEHLNISPNITPSNEQKISQRSAIVVWSNAGNSSPSLIYLAHGYQYGGREESSYFSDIHNEWILLKTIHLQYPYQRFDLFDLDANRWIEGSKVDDYSTSACIQFASRDRCQFLTCTIIDDIGEFNIASTFMAIQDSQTFTSDNHSLHILWELFDAQKGQSKSKNILSDQITIPYWPNASVEVETYTERMCLISIFHPVNNKRKAEDKVLDTLLMFFVFGKISANTSPQSLFDARDYGQLRPIDGSDKGYILWSRSMVDSIITKLYSEKIIVLQTGKTLDVLDARNGNLLRSISLPLYANLIPFLGSLCQAVDRKYKKSWFIDMHTGRIYKPPACLIKKVTQDDNEDESLGLIEVLDLPSARQDKSWISFGYKVSSGVIGLIDGNGRYEAYML
ncbi:hypothetical protein BDF19DRAFT_438121 [Syncephalis fuscata]|nr:hypothetical protein BDF19DRAFT_438121 [Syncephalis fuscata]